MRKRRIICVAVLGLCCAVVGVALLLYDYARADVLGGPLPAPRLPRDIIQLTPVENPSGEAREVDALRQHAVESSRLRLRKLPRR